MSASLAVSASDRHSKSKPCPICGGHAQMDQGKGERCWGYAGTNGSIFCTRIDNIHAKSSSEDAAIHFRDGRCQCGQSHSDGSNPKPYAWQTKSMDWLGEAPQCPKEDARVLVKDPPKPWKHPDEAIETTYHYANDQGSEYTVEVVRFTDEYRANRKGIPKTLSRFKTDAGVFSGLPSAIGKTDGVHLYREHDALEAIRMGYPLYIVEGEKDADRAKSAGLCATTNICGALSFKRMHAETIVEAWLGAGKDSQVFLVLDRDGDGVKRGERIAERLIEAGLPAARIRAVQSATEGDGDDLADHLEAGFGPNELKHVDLNVLVYAGTATPTVTPGVVSLDTIQPKPIEWLWRGYLPKGKITDVVGDGDLGKSLVMLDIAARISTGRAMPCEPETETREPWDVVLLVAEDDLADTVVPRLIAAGADLTRIHAFTDESGITFPDNIGRVEAVIRDKQAVLLLIDPIMAFLGEGVKSGIDSSVRKAIGPLKPIAEKYGCSVMSLRHSNKDTKQAAANRGGGSVAFRNISRAGLAFGPDHEDPTESRRFMAQSKKNLGRKAETLAYRIESSFGLVEVEGEDGTPVVVWEGTADGITVTEILGPPPKDERGPREGTKTEQATQYIKERLSGAKSVAASVMNEELATRGFSAGVIETARKYAGVVTERVSQGSGGDGAWFWALG